MAENNIDVKKMPFERAIEELEIDRQAPGRGQGAA